MKITNTRGEAITGDVIFTFHGRTLSASNIFKPFEVQILETEEHFPTIESAIDHILKREKIYENCLYTQ